MMKDAARIRLPLAQASRRQWLKATGAGLGGLALETMLSRGLGSSVAHAATIGQPDFPAKAKRAIWLFMAGGPSHLDLLDYKPGLKDRFGQDLPPSVLGSQRLSTMTSGQGKFPVAPASSASRSTGNPAPGSASCCRGPPSWPTTSP